MLDQRIVTSLGKAGARLSGVNGYLMAETTNLRVLFTPQGGVLLSGHDASLPLSESDYDLLRVILNHEPPRAAPADAR